MLVLVLASGCGGGGGGGGGGEPVGCTFVPGQVTTSAGGSAGQSNYTLLLDEPGSSLYIYFNNINLTFVPRQTNGSGFTQVSSEIVQLGDICLDEVSGWPGGTTAPVTAFLGATYMVRFERTPVGQSTTVHLAAFTVDAYSDGVVTYTWVGL
ncbi:MAG: hypothetical protein AB7U23_11260 [Dehalococcoidia bacterium]